MQRISLLLSLLIVCFVTAAQAQTTMRRPDPGLKQLQILLGHWTYEGEYKPGPLASASKVSGEFDNRMILSGFFLKGEWSEKSANGPLAGLEVLRYDPGNKNIAITGYQNDGSTYSGALPVSGNTVTTAEKFIVGRKEYVARGTLSYTADWTSATWHEEISTDGKIWVPWWEFTLTKVRPATRK
ncbi:MAG TPA: DUF1579 family protein [Candidatus Sulfotelmatobacter sp.]|nr:DUF1579 family protein [Candidatus Sulfotelmatobacter sp.]